MSKLRLLLMLCLKFLLEDFEVFLIFIVFWTYFEARDLSRNMRLDETRPVMCCTSSEVPWASSYGHFFGTTFFEKSILEFF